MGRIATAVAWAALSGCALRPLDPARPIEVERRWYGAAYGQDGEGIGRCRLALALHEAAEDRKPTRSAGVYATNGLLLLGAGVGAGIAATQTSGGTSAALIGASAASLLVSAVVFHRADRRLGDAVRLHNARVGRAPLARGAALAAPPPALRCPAPAGALAD